MCVSWDVERYLSSRIVWEVQCYQLDVSERVWVHLGILMSPLLQLCWSSTEKQMVMFVQRHVMERKAFIWSLSEGSREDTAKGLHSSAEGSQH